MKPTKMRNNTIYRATNMVRSKQLGSPLSEELRQKYGKRSIRIVEGDTVKITRGEFRGIDGKVSQVSIAKNSVAIEGVKKEKAKGDKFDVFIHTSKVLITGLNDKDKWRMEKLEGKKGKLAKSKPKAESETNVKKQKETKPKTKETEDEE